MGHSGGTGSPNHIGQATPMILVLMGSDDGFESVPGQDQKTIGLGCGIDKGLLAGFPASEKIGIVVVVAHSQLGNNEMGEFPYITRTTYAHVAGIHSFCPFKRPCGQNPR